MGKMTFAGKIGTGALSTFVVAAAVGCSAAPTERSEASGQEISAGDILNFSTQAHPGSCMDALAGGTTDGTQIQEYTCNGTGAQSFELEDAGNGAFYIVNTQANKCVDVQARGTANGTKIQLYDCNQTVAQAFFTQDAGGGLIYFVNTNSNKCLDVQADNPANGTLVQLYDCNQTNAQKWNPAVVGSGAGGTSGGGGGGGGGVVDTTTLTGSQTVALAGNTYVLQGDEWNSSAPMSIGTDGNVDFKVVTDGLSNAVGQAPGAYPSFFYGCHWGTCTANSGLPLSVATIETAGTVTTSISCTNDIGGAWDNSYDIWFNTAASTNDNGANGLEMMVWLANAGGTRPAGNEVAANVQIAGQSFNVFYAGTGGTSSPLLSYQLSTPGTSFNGLDIGALAADAVSRGYMTRSWFLIDVEAGFELWDGGQGLAVNSFSVTVH